MIIQKYLDVYDPGNGREVTNAEPEEESVWLEPPSEANVELVVVLTKEAVVLEADKIWLLVADAVHRTCVSECPVEEGRVINTKTRREIGLTNRLASCFAGVSIRV